MADMNRIEADLQEYLSNEKNFRRDEKLKALMLIFQKHIGMDTLSHCISLNDLHTIVSTAAHQASFGPSSVKIAGQTVSGHNPVHIAMIEAVLLYLNRHSLLQRKVGFDYDHLK